MQKIHSTLCMGGGAVRGTLRLLQQKTLTLS
jgi:hypothetical protein